jgi:hypothetical protein
MAKSTGVAAHSRWRARIPRGYEARKQRATRPRTVMALLQLPAFHLLTLLSFTQTSNPAIPYHGLLYPLSIVLLLCPLLPAPRFLRPRPGKSPPKCRTPLYPVALLAPRHPGKSAPQTSPISLLPLPLRSQRVLTSSFHSKVSSP